MSAEDVQIARRAMELFIGGDRDEAWALFSADSVGYPPGDWPESGPFRGRDEQRGAFDGWNVTLGEDWTSHLGIRDIIDLGDSRVLLELEFAPTAVESGLPAEQKLALILTVRGGEIVRADYFMKHEDARSAAGLE